MGPGGMRLTFGGSCLNRAQGSRLVGVASGLAPCVLRVSMLPCWYGGPARPCFAGAEGREMILNQCHRSSDLGRHPAPGARLWRKRRDPEQPLLLVGLCARVRLCRCAVCLGTKTRVGPFRLCFHACLCHRVRRSETPSAYSADMGMRKAMVLENILVTIMRTSSSCRL